MIGETRNGQLFGYSYDLWMFSVEDTKSDDKTLNMDSLKYEASEYSPSMAWFPFSDSAGVFYNFVSCGDEIGGTIFLQKNEEKKGTYFVVPWRTTEETTDAHYVKVHDEYKSQVAKAFTAIIDRSPVRKAYFCVRCQCHEKHNIIGMLTVQEMQNIIMKDGLLGNVVYVIYDP